jgi:hypothetical protein
MTLQPILQSVFVVVKQLEFIEKIDYETLKTLILNIALNTHLNNNKNLSNDIDLPSIVNP